mmetsp:Transcript_51762/g.136748  ORF Transcript_51762/g.136748 Transcript_51762/m.136748 type:complete len:205 (+) Transcript_51762:2734-3348(+)
MEFGEPDALPERLGDLRIDSLGGPRRGPLQHHQGKVRGGGGGLPRQLSLGTQGPLLGVHLCEDVGHVAKRHRHSDGRLPGLLRVLHRQLPLHDGAEAHCGSLPLLGRGNPLLPVDLQAEEGGVRAEGLLRCRQGVEGRLLLQDGRQRELQGRVRRDPSRSDGGGARAAGGRGRGRGRGHGGGGQRGGGRGRGWGHVGGHANHAD